MSHKPDAVRGERTFARRKAVMGRSIKLGHCVCDPQKPCPCNLLKQYNVCQCAGEKLPVKTDAVALTKLVHKAGCASKIAQADLLQILGKLPVIADPNVLVGAAAGDDAGIYRLDDRHALVQTVDVFTPCVDDPYLFGQIAAANSLSDVYAMGGKPLTALSIVGFPIDDLDGAILEKILRGGIDKMAEADCAVIGGHSINDAEIKCGFAVTGEIWGRYPIFGAKFEETEKDENRVASPYFLRDKARPGDMLVLTKPLGTGIISFAAQLDRIDAAALAEAGAAMATLNRDAAELMAALNANACTDITGYGLAGHLVQMVRNSGVDAEIDLAALPLFSGVEKCLDEEILPGSIEQNQEYAMAWVVVENDAAARLPVLYDPQTSGGLLISLPPEPAEKLVKEMHRRGHAATTIIGRIREKKPEADGKIFVKNSHGGVIHKKEILNMPEQEKHDPEMTCCGNDPSTASTTSTSSTSDLSLFTDFMKAVNKPGLIDARAKKLMAIALSVAQRCEPCLKIHLKSAMAMGLSMAEIDEAAHLAIAFGGCTAMMFYKEIRDQFSENPKP